MCLKQGQAVQAGISLLAQMAADNMAPGNKPNP
jgi:hypothetical protein